MFLRIMWTRRHRSVGTLKKCTARKLIVHSWCPKSVLTSTQSFMFASDEAFQKVGNEAIAENLGACHQDEKLTY